MDLSEFNPPIRQSLTDEEISAKLGAAPADEAGMLAAMQFLEEQTALRDQDNQAFIQWQAKMQTSENPLAKIALENIERGKAGLSPLPLEVPLETPEVVTEPDVEVVSEVSADPNPSEGSAEEAAEAFEELLENTQPAVKSEPAVEVVERSVTAEVEEEVASEPKPVGYKLVSISNWILGVGVLAPVAAAVFATINGLNFVTSVLAGLVGLLVGVKVNVFAFITARRTNRGLAVASRASFGVFGAIAPGVLLLVAGIADILAIGFGSVHNLQGRIVGLPEDFSKPVLEMGVLRLDFAGLLTIALLTVTAILAVFGGKFARVLKVILAAFVLAGFLVFAIYTTTSIDYLNLAGIFQLPEFLIVAPLFALLASVFTYALDSESVSIASWGVSNKRLFLPMAFFGFLLPLLSYAHMAALLNGRDLMTDANQAISTILTVSGEFGGTVLLDTAIVAIVGLLYMGLSKVIESVKTVGANHIGYGSAITAMVAVVLFSVIEALLVAQPLAFNIGLVAVLLIPGAYWIGVALTEALVRRGNYHDASLTRGYGFYGAFNWTAFGGYLVGVVVALGITQPITGVSWLGFLRGVLGFEQPVVYSAFLAMAFAVIYTLATGIPRIIRQQKETKAVEDRKYDLVDVVVD